MGKRQQRKQLEPIQISEVTMPAPFLRTPYNYDRDAATNETGIDCSVEPSKTQQHFIEESDINTIVKRFHLTGELPTNVRMPQQADFEGVFDFQTAMNAIRAAEESFAAMPADVRTRFNNDPHLFVEFCSNDENRPEAEKLGLVKPKAPPIQGNDAPPPTEPPKPA